MKAFIDDADEVIIDYKGTFRRDPIKELLEDKKGSEPLQLERYLR